MAEISKTVSQFIENQFPAIYREDGEVLVNFVKAYYEYLEENDHLINRDMFTIKDIDTTYDSFLVEFQKKYLEDFPFTSATDARFLAKNILDLYRAKGSDESIKLLFKLLFNEEAEVYYPGGDVLRASDSLWINPQYVEVLSSDRSISFINKRVFGSVSAASAFVDAIVTKRSNNRLIDILYLSDVEGQFIFGDIISDNGILQDAPRVVGSLTEVEITGSGADPGGNEVGDTFQVVSEFGRNGVTLVSKISDATTGVVFDLIDGGYGYTLTDDTKILVTDLIVLRDNANTVFSVGENVHQKVEKILLDPTTGIELYNAVSVGDTISGTFSSNTAPVTATVLRKGQGTFDNIVRKFLDVQPLEDDAFIRKESIVLTTPTLYEIDTDIEGVSTYQIEVELTSNTNFVVGETINQRSYYANTSSNLFASYGFGTVSDITGNVITIVDGFGDFVVGGELEGETSDADGFVTEVTVLTPGIAGTITSKVSNTEYIVATNDDFSANTRIRDTKHEVLSTVGSSSNITVEALEFGSVTPVTDFGALSQRYEGTVLDQTDEAIKIYTRENEFIFVANNSLLIGESTNDLVIDDIGQGSGAGVKIGSLENTEMISLYDELVGGTNVRDINYLDILIDSRKSGLGHLNNIVVNDGGTGYANTSTVTFTGGGYQDQNPLEVAEAEVVTDGTGAITAINLTDLGGGYYDMPAISVSDGSGANLSIQMIHGYGFPKNPPADYDTIIAEGLTENAYEIGTIASLTENRPGQGYRVAPAVSVVNDKISFYSKYDQRILINAPTGTFQTGEIVTQANTTARGVVTAANTTAVEVKNISFDQYFDRFGGDITGMELGITAAVTEVETLSSNPVMGENANIFNDVDLKEGAIEKLRVINSGFGYQDGEIVTLRNGDLELTGRVVVSKQGLEPGYWKSTTSHLNSEKKLHDNRYYQDFSYDIKTAINIDKYRDAVLDILHVAGTQFFGSLVKSTDTDTAASTESVIEQV